MLTFSDLRVLLVEDEDNVRASLKSMLEEMGITKIKETSNGLEALGYFDAQPAEVDMIICDWNMPHKSGFEFLREIRQSRPELPFLMVTARADKISVLAARDNEVTAYVRKPFTFDELRGKISQWVDSKNRGAA